MNPAVGYERTLSDETIEKAETPRKVVVVGGGVAGMEAARTALLAGHRVTLVEAMSDLGGLLNCAKHLPKLHPIGDIAIWLENEIYRLGADVRLSTYVDADDVLAEEPDAVIVATGSQPADVREFRQTADPAAQVQIAREATVLTSLDLAMAPPQELGRTALVFDDVGHYEAIGCCEALINRGVEVAYVTRHRMFAPAAQRGPAARRHAVGAGVDRPRQCRDQTPLRDRDGAYPGRHGGGGLPGVAKRNLGGVARARGPTPSGR
ncbi:FAD/NAD(P)-binding oxidoreductase [Burkholderia diffusa]|uniref:FAD-dependent oxidoreductase n=1 Tax=Burkholderia diffusa TaxID=488732 RepID=UPI0026530F95|nr:FAD/NAD(P)-binding oxidoreductase [Burkholderia diffusa]MDN7907505.1 FAD/NAD(P)-binding oxidoreductase [Burkholderia diffusa]